VSETVTPIRFTGSLVVRFHGDPNTGCAAAGLCGYAGTIVWQPSSTGKLLQYRYRLGGTIHEIATLLAGAFYGSGAGARTTSRVSSATDGTNCADETAGGSEFALSVTRAGLTVALGKPISGLIVTRCAGPLDADVMAALPAAAVGFAAASRGDLTVGLAASRPFASHGFAGMVESNLELSLGRPQPQPLSSGVPFGPTRRYRQTVVSYKATLDGSVAERVLGDANPLLCAPLGSCGGVGTITVSPRVTRAEGFLTAVAPASRPQRDVLTALGMVSGGRTRGVELTGDLEWTAGGTYDATVAQGASTCSDSGQAGGGSITLWMIGGRLEVRYVAGGPFDTGTIHTRCPGPAPLSGFPEAAANVPTSALRSPLARIGLRTGIATADDGWTATTKPSLRLTLQRLRVRTTVFRAPGP
jgi:hypothetical protein